ncbi:MAG TPA: hypothetical protein VNQ31_09030 [Sphingomonadaceae bacterium]|nr:hypothetical protein [Sphingomonadaceae bacterium]
MFPFRHSSLFRSRWIALLWAAGIVWWAIDVAGKPADPPADQPAANADSPEMDQAVAVLQRLGD